MDIKTIILGVVVANCYLIRTNKGFILIDTGRAGKRTKLENELESAGCKPGNLNLIILTHGDFDHSGNCAYLREKFNTKIAMHSGDFGMVEQGDMFCNRKTGNYIAKKIVNALFKITEFKPDFQIDEDFDLLQYGLNAKILHLPGHSKGSIGIITADGELICGDIFTNMGKPALNSMIDDREEAKASIQKIRSLNVNTVYPGHGKPFLMSSLKNNALLEA
ncbi:MAG: MBL fold metallo-hydrolase [Clostridia bacterium]|nr:MBL fold metallo-hydrolase [Clostridia bacterium]